MDQEKQKKRGRPEKPDVQPRIKPSKEGRLSFTRGKSHTLDVQFKEARLRQEQLTTAAENLPSLLAALEAYQDFPTQLAKEDEYLATFLSEHFVDTKHVDHIQATLMIFRRTRALARVQAAEAALHLVQELLAPDPLLPSLIELLQAGQDATTQANVNREQLAGSPRLLGQQITQAQTYLHAIRAALAQSNGWIDIQYVNRERVRPEVGKFVRALNKQRKDGTSIPEDVEKAISPELAEVIRARRELPEELEKEVYQTYTYGPYPFLRWREGKGTLYSVSLADVTVEMPERFRMGGYFAIRRRKG